MKSSQAGPAVSHLFFIDDPILFAEASHTQVEVMKHCLDMFCQVSGQAVNFDKSVIFCSPNTSKEWLEKLALFVAHLSQKIWEDT